LQIVGDEEFSRMWGLVQMAPGINLLALTILIGRRCGGAFGVALSLLGLLLPSVSLTILLTACYSHIEHYAYVRDALRGVVPATVGVGMMVSWKMAKPLLDSTFREGKGVFVLCAILLAASGALVYFFPHDVIFILLGAGALAAAQTSVRLKKTKEE
jgi:chromate transporter